ncbi:hypothetical protein [Mycobacterium paraense]|uniref:hypothetical protein n=1 Tax=Mycobacterium paraense TaxID=767916 RepID=UPI00111C2517|nr:hypothetical protein [Mycobacterium paraense]
MLGFAIVDRQPTAKATAVWLTCHLEGSRVNHTNAVVIEHGDDRHDAKLWHLTADRAVVLTRGTTPPIPFKYTRGVEVFGDLLDETTAYQQRISDAVASYAARTKNRSLTIPEFPSHRPELKIDNRDQPEYRALSAANYVRDAWSAWLATDEERARRTVNPRTGTTPWIMPDELGSPTLADFPSEFGRLVKPEPLIKPAWVS